MKKGPPKKGECRPLTTGERLAVKQGDVKLCIYRGTGGDLWIMEDVIEGEGAGILYGSDSCSDETFTKHLQQEMLESLAEYWKVEGEVLTQWYGFRMTEAQWEHLQQRSMDGKVSVALRHIIDESMKNWC